MQMEAHDKFLNIRLCVTGLAEDLSETELRDKFGGFGLISHVDFIYDDENRFRGLAYIEMELKKSALKRCIDTFSRCRWRGKEMQVQVARRRLEERFQREHALNERRRAEHAADLARASHERVHRDPAQHRIPICEMDRYIVDGLVPDEQLILYDGWKPARFSRLYKVMNMFDPRLKKYFNFDPTKSVNRFKRIKYEHDEFEAEHDRIKAFDALCEDQQSHLAELDRRRAEHSAREQHFFSSISEQREAERAARREKIQREEIQVIDDKKPKGQIQPADSKPSVPRWVDEPPKSIATTNTMLEVFHTISKLEEAIHQKPAGRPQSKTRPAAKKPVAPRASSSDDSDGDFYSFVQSVKKEKGIAP